MSASYSNTLSIFVWVELLMLYVNIFILYFFTDEANIRIVSSIHVCTVEKCILLFYYSYGLDK